MMNAWIAALAAGFVLWFACVAHAQPKVVEAIDISPVWAGHPVGFALLTDPERGVQYVAYYDAERRMTVASRRLDDKAWTKQVLPSTVGWDSHNYIALALDENGDLHVSGNMHNDPLVYFRTERAGDVTSLRQVPQMTGKLEQRVTYPVFIKGPEGELIYRYRNGGSGSGNEYYNLYDADTKTWSRLLDTPLTDGQGKMNAYPAGPSLGPDGYFHLCWVWRDTPDCATNHDLSYARSRDLRNWENYRGEPLDLPITIDSPGTIIDPVPPGGGMINGNTKIGFDSQDRPILSYHKHDADGNTQIYSRRLEDGEWVEYQTSDWDYRWDFSGYGSMIFEIRLGPVSAGSDGTLRQQFSHAKYGSGVWILDEATLQPTATEDRQPQFPPELAKTESDFPGIQVKWANDAGKSDQQGVSYVLRWETLPTNQDRPREGDLPDPSQLRLYKLDRGTAE